MTTLSRPYYSETCQVLSPSTCRFTKADSDFFLLHQFATSAYYSDRALSSPFFEISARSFAPARNTVYIGRSLPRKQKASTPGPAWVPMTGPTFSTRISISGSFA